jgi:hypothetical protein
MIKSNAQCSQCFKYYVLNEYNCSLDISCNLIASCQGCPYGYYLLNSSCLPCITLQSNFLTCNSNSQCVLCYQGYFLSNNSCSPCNSICKECSSIAFCNQAADGYFLQYLIDGSNSGAVLVCQSPCLSCQYNAKYCLTCINGYSVSGSTCIPNALLTAQITVGPSNSNMSIFTANDSSSIQLAKSIRDTNRIFSSICAGLPASLKVGDPNC